LILNEFSLSFEELLHFIDIFVGLLKCGKVRPNIPKIDNFPADQDRTNQAKFLRDLILKTNEVPWTGLKSLAQLLLSSLKLKSKLLRHVFTFVVTQQRYVRVNIIYLIGERIQSDIQYSIGIKAEKSDQLIDILLYGLDIAHVYVWLVQLNNKLCKAFILLPQ